MGTQVGSPQAQSDSERSSPTDHVDRMDKVDAVQSVFELSIR